MRKILIAAVIMLVVLLGAAKVFADSPFSDVKDGDWFCKYVQEAKDRGVIGGYPDGTFRPQDSVTYAEFIVMAIRGQKTSDTHGSLHWATPYYYKAIDDKIFGTNDIAITQMDLAIPRKDMAVIMAGVLAKYNLAGIATTNASYTYKDVPANSYYESAVALCSEYGCLFGYPDRTFRPERFLTRAEVAAAMVALLKIVGGDADHLYQDQRRLPLAGRGLSL